MRPPIPEALEGLAWADTNPPCGVVIATPDTGLKCAARVGFGHFVMMIWPGAPGRYA